MAKAAIVSFVIDLKLTPGGEVKILEFGDLYRSGFSGYERLTGNSPLIDKVFPFYERFGLPVYQAKADEQPEGYRHQRKLEDRMGIVALPVGDGPFDAGRLASHSAIVTHPEFTTEEQRKELLEGAGSRILTTNSNGVVNACFEDKTILAALGDKYAPRLFPRQKLYPVDGGRLDLARLLEDFRDTGTVVLKTPWDANAQGVDLIDTKKLTHAFNARAGHAYLKFFKKPSLRHLPACVVQEYAAGKLVTAENADGITGAYEPTMRVFATAWHDGGQTFIKCHDAYYKMPPRPASEELNRKNSISKVYGNSGPKSAPVPDEDKALTFSQLEEGLPALFQPLFSVPAREHARTFLQSGDTALARVGYQLAAQREYFDRPPGQEEYPEDIAALIYANRARLPGVSRMLVRAKPANDPAGLREALLEKAKADGVRPKKAIGPALAMAVGGGIFFGSLIGLLALDDKEPPQIAAKIFDPANTDGAVNGMTNLRSYKFDTLKATSVLRRAIAGQAQKAGFGVCGAGRWNDEASRLLPAFQQAAKDPQQIVIKVDFESSEHIEHDGMTIDDRLVTDTVIYGSHCPVKP